ncbi:MAG: class I SAM-dependent methyltransferase [Dehalococcoidia bacterium]
MNAQHLKLCSSAEWDEGIRTRLMPWVARQPSLGDAVLEVGPGPGLTTDQLRLLVPHLTAVEADATLAAQLAARLAGTNTTVVHADATSLPFDDRQFSGAASFFMLHHVPSPALQDQLFAQLARVLQPGGVLLAVDSLDSPPFRDLHDGDICVPLDPATIAQRLEQAGFVEVDVTIEGPLCVVARTPGTVGR